MVLRRPHIFQGNLLRSIRSNGSLANHVSSAAAAAAVFDIGAVATFLPDSTHPLHRSALRVITPVETLPIKNVKSHADSGQPTHVTAHLVALFGSMNSNQKCGNSDYMALKSSPFKKCCIHIVRDKHASLVSLKLYWSHLHLHNDLSVCSILQDI